MKRLLLLMIIGIMPVMAVGGRSFSEGYDIFRPYGFQPEGNWYNLRQWYGGGVNYVDLLKESLQNRKDSYLICPWWIENLYSTIVTDAHCRKGIGYVGYVLNPMSGEPELTNEWKNGIGQTVLNTIPSKGVPYDLVVYCRDGQMLDRFLCSETARLNFLNRVFAWPDGLMNQKHGGVKPRGLNFYFPDFSFREKREFVQFMRSVNRVIRLFCQPGNSFPYKECVLSVTLPTKAVDEKDYLAGLVTLVDDIHFTDYDEFGVPVALAGTLNKYNNFAPFYQKFVNRFYLFKLNTVNNLQGKGSGDMTVLARMDSSVFNWKLYFLIGVALTAMLVVLILCYHLWGSFYVFVDRFDRILTPVLIALILEIFVVFYFMLEALSGDVIWFNMAENTYLWLLMVPIVCVVICFIVYFTRGRTQLP